MSCTLEIIEQEAAFRSLEQDWWRLWARVPRATPFQSPAWLLPWWEAFAPGSLSVLTVRREGRLIGFVPFYVDAERRALPIGVSLSDYLDVLIDPEESASAISLLSWGIADALGSGISEWEMQELAPGAQAFGLAPKADTQCSAMGVCPVLQLPDKTGDLSCVIPASKLRKLRMAQNRAERAGGCEIDTCRGPRLSEGFFHLVRLHGAQWKERGGGVLADPRAHHFHRQAMQELDRTGLLNLLVCRIDGMVAGVYYGLKYGAQAYAYICGYDLDKAFVSPGTLLLGRAIEQAMQQGASEFHFLRGSESYKYEWGATDRTNARRVFRPARINADA
jgi:CelD/BcsL family acetyltransferase involved in cellulose biosynthesis